MSPSHRVSRRLRAVVVLALVLPLLTSCASSFYPPTDRYYTPGVGTNEQSSSVDVLNVVVVSGEDGSGTLVASLVNNDLTQNDTLTSVTGSGESADLTVQAQPVEVPAGELVGLLDEGQVTVEGEAVRAGFFVELTFTFEDADPVTLKAPVVSDTDAYAEVPVP